MMIDVRNVVVGLALGGALALLILGGLKYGQWLSEEPEAPLRQDTHILPT